MWKKVLAGTAALVIAGSGLAYAQADRGAEGWRWRPSAEDLGAFADARIAALHAGLKLNPDQEKNWPAFEQAYREFAKYRIARRVELREGPRDDRADNPVERWQRQADLFSTRGAALKKLAEAASPLYGSLDDAQKRRFLVLSRIGQNSWNTSSDRSSHGSHMRGPHGGMGGMHRHQFEGRRDMMGPGERRRGMMEPGFDRPRGGAHGDRDERL